MTTKLTTKRFLTAELDAAVGAVAEIRVQTTVAAGELATVTVGDFGARMVPRAEVEELVRARGDNL